MENYIADRPINSRSKIRLLQIIIFCLLTAVGVHAQAPPNPIPAPENIPAGSLIIPMDNVNQGNAPGTRFNLRAYGLANQLLQNNIPLKWAIKPGKSKDDADFSADVTRIAGTAGIAGSASVSFSGGPFIVPYHLVTPGVMNLITSFNSGFEADVTVYQTNNDNNIDIRYSLNHKPKIAIGPDGGNFGPGVHQALFDSAGIGSLYYTSVTNDIILPSECYTLATQAHSESSAFVSLYRDFVVSGGNLLLQCASVGTFENSANGHFQTTLPGYSWLGTNPPANDVDTTLLYPVGEMPFNQFIGILANQDGAVTEFAFAPGGGGVNGHLISVQNSGADAGQFVATVSQLNGANAIGGTVFELGGHDYIRNNTNASLLSRLNGQRMVLNALFVPVERPCASVQSGISGFKSVKRIVPSGAGGPIKPGNTVRWTIEYINTTQVDIANFQVKDIIVPTYLAVVPLSVQVQPFGATTSASPNPGYTGLEIGATSDLLIPGAKLASGGRIQIIVDMIVNPNTPKDTILANQTVASGPNLTEAPSLRSDNIDSQTVITSTVPVPQPSPGSWPQVQTSGIDPTVFPVADPTAATVSIEGSVRTPDGSAIAGAVVTATNAVTGGSTAVRSNSFGRYRIEGPRSGDLYFVSVQHKLYQFPGGGPVTFTLNDNVTGLAFVGVLPGSKSGRQLRTFLSIDEPLKRVRPFIW